MALSRKMEDALQDLHESRVEFRTLFRHLAERPRGGRELTVPECCARLERDAEQSSVRRTARTKRVAREFLLGLAGLGLGDYVVGRRGHVSRLVWGSSDPVEVARLARGESSAFVASQDASLRHEIGEQLTEIEKAAESLKQTVAEAREYVAMIEQRLDGVRVPVNAVGILLTRVPLEGNPDEDWVTQLGYFRSGVGRRRGILIASGIERDPETFSLKPLIECDEETVIKAVPRLPELLRKIAEGFVETEEALLGSLPEKDATEGDRTQRPEAPRTPRRGHNGRTGGPRE